MRFRDFLTVQGTKDLKEGVPLPFLYSQALDLLDSVAKKDTQLVVTIDATYSGYLLNNRVYPGKYMGDRKSWGTWISTKRGGTSPYDKPLLTHHDQEKGDPIGRVVAAQWHQLWPAGDRFQDDWRQPSTRYKEGSGKIVIDAEVLDPDAQLKVLDGRYSTFSSGQSSRDAWCSVCGHNIGRTGTWCEHVPGRTYEIGEDEDSHQVSMYLVTGYLDYHEGSFVNIPGNAFAMVTEIKSDDLAKVGGKVEDSLHVEHADSYGVAEMPSWSSVKLRDAQGGVTDLVRPDGAKDEIPYGRDNVRGSVAVAVIEDVAATADEDHDAAEGAMDRGAFALANVARSLFYADGEVEVQRGARTSDRIMYGPYTYFRTITEEANGHQHVLDLEVNLRSGSVTGYTSLTSDSASEHGHAVEMTVDDLNALKKGVKGKTAAPMGGESDKHVHKFSVAFGTTDCLDDDIMSLDQIVDRIAELESRIDANELADFQVRRLRPVGNDLEILEAAGRAPTLTDAARKPKNPVYCGPGRSFPVPDYEHIVAARKLIPLMRASADTKAKVMQRVNKRAGVLGYGGTLDAAGSAFARLKGQGNMSTTKTKEVQPPANPPAGSTTDTKEGLGLEDLQKLTRQQTDQIGELTEEKKALQSTADSTRAQLDQRTEEVADLRDSLRNSLAGRLVLARMVTQHADTLEIKTQEDFDTLATSYAERTIESLEDAIKDSTPEFHRAITKATDGRANFMQDTDPVDDPVGKHGVPSADSKDNTEPDEVSEKDIDTL